MFVFFKVFVMWDLLWHFYHKKRMQWCIIVTFDLDRLYLPSPACVSQQGHGGGMEVWQYWRTAGSSLWGWEDFIMAHVISHACSYVLTPSYLAMATHQNNSLHIHKDDSWVFKKGTTWCPVDMLVHAPCTWLPWIIPCRSALFPRANVIVAFKCLRSKIERVCCTIGMGHTRFA